MEGSSKGSSKRKPAFTMKVKMVKKRSSDSEDDYNSDDSFKPIKKKKSLRADNSDIDSIPDLPEGTVVVKPEAVKEKKPRFSGPEFSKAPENLDIVNCTSCGRQINPNLSGSAKRHPDLKVLVCRKCYSYYRSGKIEQDEDGLDEQCRWCGEGGRLSGCDFCHNAFCKSCIIRNFSRGEYSKVTADDGSKWKCYVCDPSKLKKLAKECTVLLEKVEREKMKAKMQGSKDGRTSSAKSQKTAGKPTGKTKRKKQCLESSSDDDNEDDQMDDFDEDEDNKPHKLQNGKAESGPIENGEELENEIAKNDLMAELNDEENDDEDDEDSDTDEDVKNKKKKGKSAKKSSEDKENGEESDDEKESARGKRKRLRGKLLDARVSDSDSDFNVKKSKKKKVTTEDSDSEEIGRKKSRKKKSSEEEDSEDESDDGKKKKRGRPKKGKGKKKKAKKKSGNGSDSFEQSSSSSEDTDSEVSLDTSEEERREQRKAERKAKRKAKGKRRRIKEQADSSDEDKKKPIEDSSEYDTKSENDGGEDDGQSPDKSGRKNIRKIKSNKTLTEVTKRARKAEEARRKRVAERQKQFNHIVQETDEVTKIPVTTQLVLEFDKETKEPIIQVDKKLIRKLKPHQVEAVQFIWDCVCESVDRLQRKGGSGCILAHCMGLGKTLSVVTFIHTMLKNPKLTKMKTCLVVCPLNTVINWTNECDMWFEEGDKIDIYEMSSIKQNWPRADYLKDWHSGGGIMIIGYEMYRNLTQSARVKNKKQKAIFQETLVEPGPDLVVCDEGHILKNDSSAISQAMNKVRTRRRIVLTGTPLQNNLVEYHCMANFVKPDLLGTRKEFSNRFVNPIINGQHSDSTSYDVKVMTRRAHVLHEMLNGCVQRRNYSALTKFLPPKFEYVISVRLMPKQIELYEKYLALSGNGANMQPVTRGARLFSDYQNLMKIWTHPWVLKLSEIRAESKMKYDDSEDSFIDNSSASETEEGSMSDSEDSDKVKSDVSDESEEAGTSTGRTRRTRRGRPPQSGDSDKEEIVKDWKTRSRGGEGDDDLMEIDEGPKAVSSEWWAEFVKEEDETKLELSGKLTLLFEILRMCEEIGDKVLIFSQSLLSLNIIEDFLDQIDRKTQEEAGKKKENEGEKKEGDEKENEENELIQTEFGKSWTKGADYFRMDGSTSPQLRSHWSDIFNDPENFRARLFLISTRAGSLGINLVAANRVIIFDASWNPSHDIQSIFRVYRFGQTKPCYVYRFLAQGTMEEKIYERQVTKQSLSQRVVDEHQIDRHFTQADLTELYTFAPDRLDDPNRKPVVHSLPKDVLLAELLKSREDCMVKFHEHDSLLENREDQTLSEEEKKAAWEEYENERKGVSNRVAQASTASGVGMFSPDNVLQIVQMVKLRFPNLPPDLFQAQVQAILQQQIMYQQSLQKQQIEQQRMMEMQRLHRIQQDIRSQQQQISHMSRGNIVMPPSRQMMRPPGQSGVVSLLTNSTNPLRSVLQGPGGSDSKSSTPKNPSQVIDLS